MIFDNELKMGFTSIERELDSYIEINGFKYSSIDLLKDLKVNIKADKDGIWIGRAIPKMLNAEIINNGNVINAGDEIKPYFGVRIGDSYKYINVGTFYAQTPELTEDRKIIKVVAYDKFKKAQTLKYGDISYPTTINNIVDLIASKLEVQVDKTNLMFLDYTIEKEIFFGKDKTVIELINAIAQMNICFAYIDYDNVLKFKRPERVVTYLSANNVFKIRIKGYQESYDALVISRQPQNDDVVQKMSQYQVESVEIKLSNNPILDLDREFFINTLLSTARGILPHYGLERLEMQSNPLLEIGDLVFWGNKAVLILEHEITMSRSILKSQIAEKTETDLKKAKGVEDFIVNTELYVDKVKNEIVAKIGDEVENKVVELKLDENGITQRVKSKVEEKLSDPEVQKNFKGDKGDRGEKGDTGEADYTKFRSEFSSELNLLSNQISSKVEENTYNSALGSIRTDISKLTLDLSGVSLTLETKGKYRNTLVGSDNFENYNLETRYYFSTREDGSIEFGIPSYVDTKETFFLFPLDRLEYINERDKATLLIDNLFINSNITRVVFSLADKNKQVVSNAFIHRDNSKIYEFTLTGKPEYLRVALARNNIDTIGSVRFYKETIAVVAGSVSNLTWDMTYINDSKTQYKFLKDEFLLSLGTLKTELKGDINGLSLSGSKITLTGDTKINGTFKIGANNLSEIGGFRITNSVLEGGSGSNYIRLSGNPGYTSILVGGNTWESAKFAVSSTGTLKAEGANISGTITANSGSIGNWNITSNGIYRSGNGYYVHIIPTSTYPIFFGADSNNSKFRVSQTGVVLARAFTLEGGKVGGTNVYSSYMSGGSWSSATGSGSFSGNASFSSGSYTGSGYLHSGSTLAGYSVTNNGGYLELSHVYVSNRFSTRNFDLGSGSIQGVYHSGAGGYMYASLGTTGWRITNSDIRLKENVKTMGDDTVKEIYTLPLIEYNYKSDETKVLNYGVNANLLSKILPEKFSKSFIFKDKNSGLYGAKYEMLTPHLVKAVQDLNKRLERLENE